VDLAPKMLQYTRPESDFDKYFAASAYHPPTRLSNLGHHDVQKKPIARKNRIPQEKKEIKKKRLEKKKKSGLLRPFGVLEQTLQQTNPVSNECRSTAS